ncbi:aminotransferase class I/II-fold pyridoxal phosphate-dependent enzyme [Pontibacter chitinilyticus]|uniref:aminotransferase class I/II-fold pyridoxal phosphate-dependent enzyme n=1 Tax=Pontibacter chitinilyticus TaxID=2674989 RepID=UPI00321953BF
MPSTDNLYTDQLPGRTLVVEGVEYLYCSGTSYLGISRNEAFRACLWESMQRYGTNYSSSRNGNLQLRVYDDVESYLAHYTGAEAALTVSSGYLAGQLLVQTLAEEGRFLYAPGTHPAVWRSATDAPDNSLSFEVWVAQVLESAPAIPEQHLIIVCNSLDPLQVRDYDFNWVQELATKKQVTLIVDDSHGFGVTGRNGAGVYSQLSHLQGVRLLVVSSFGKAFGIPAGVILGDRQVIAQLKSSPCFGGASPAVPAYLDAFLRSEKLFEEARQKLFANIAYFTERLAQPGRFNSLPLYPVFNTPEEALCPFLQQHRVLISSFRYPTPADDPITRVILNSLHTTDDLQRLTTLINQFEPD